MTADRGDEKRTAPSAERNGPRPSFGPDLLRLAQIIKDFNLARMSAGLYPPDHPLIVESLDRTYAALRELSAADSPLILAAAQDVLFVGGEKLDPRNPVFREFAVVLSSRNILSITFTPGFTRDDLILFHRILNQPAAELWKAGGAREAAGRLGLERIVLRAVDYSRFRLTEEEEVQSLAPEDEKNRRDRVWRDFVNNVVGEDPAPDKEDRRRAGAKDVDPVLLAGFINDNPEVAKAALGNYGELLTAKDGRVPAPPVLGKIGELLRGLKPELKRQLLAMTFDHWRDREDVAWEMLGGDLVAEILERAGQDHKQISPALLNLANALSAVEEHSPVRTASQGPADSAAAFPKTNLDKFQAFFAQDDRTNYLDVEYSAALGRLSRGQDGEDLRSVVPGRDPSGPGEVGSAPRYGWQESLMVDIKTALDPTRAVLHLCGLLAAFLDRELDPDDYAGFARKLVEHVPDLLAAREFERLFDILNAFRRHAAGTSAAISRTAQDALRIFQEQGFVSRSIHAFLAGSGKTKEAALFFGALDPPAVLEIADLFVRGEFPTESGRLAQLLGEMGETAVEEIMKHLGEKHASTVCQALAFLKKYGNEASLPAIRPLLRHEDDLVRTDALSTLLSLGDPGAGGALLQALRSSVEREALAAIRLAGRHRRIEAVLELQRMIRAGFFLKPDGLRNVEIVRALGRIGDSRVLLALAKLARRKALLNPGERRNLKLAIYESLEGYPRESVAGLLRAGSRAKDSRIRAICRSLQREWPAPAPTSSEARSDKGRS